MRLRCAFGWHRWKRVQSWRWCLREVWFANWESAAPLSKRTAYGNWFEGGRICADCRKREAN